MEVKLALFLCGALIPGPMLALEQTAEGFRITPSELARCAAAGGCIVIPYGDMEAEMAKWMKKAYDAGRAEACGGT